jgi:cytochrome d ubiquinol oxidase subunit II
VPVTAEREWAGSFLGLLNPYAVLVGLVTLALFTLHGALFLRMKSEGALAERLSGWIPRLWVGFAALYLAATVATAFVSPFLFEGALSNPLWVALALLVALSVAAVPLLARAGRYGAAFVASGATVVFMVLVAAVSLFPRLVPSSLGLAQSLTVYNASSSARTLGVMLVIALLGVPIMLGYTIWVYFVFRGKVRSGAHGYG